MSQIAFIEGIFLTILLSSLSMTPLLGEAYPHPLILSLHDPPPWGGLSHFLAFDLISTLCEPLSCVGGPQAL